MHPVTPNSKTQLVTGKLAVTSRQQRRQPDKRVIPVQTDAQAAHYCPYMIPMYTAYGMELACMTAQRTTGLVYFKPEYE